MGRPQQVTDEQILETARKFFINEGAGVSTEKIADALGVSQPALFKRFKNKVGLMMAAIAFPKTIPFFSELEKGPDDRPFDIQLIEIAEKVTAFLKKVSPCMMVLRTSGLKPADLMRKHRVPPAATGVKKLSHWLAACHEKGLIIEADYVSMAKGIVGGLHSPVMLHFLDPDNNELPDMNYVKVIIDVYATKLAPKEGVVS